MGETALMGKAILDQGQVGNVLAAMPKLIDLSIEGHNLGVIGANPPNVVFRHLKRAAFFCGRVSPNEVRDAFSYCSIDRDDDDQDPEWELVVADLKYMQAARITNLQSASLVSAYSAMPFTECRRNKTKSLPRSGDEVYRWTLGVGESIVSCPREDMGHEDQ